MWHVGTVEISRCPFTVRRGVEDAIGTLGREQGLTEKVLVNPVCTYRAFIVPQVQYLEGIALGSVRFDGGTNGVDTSRF